MTDKYPGVDHDGQLTAGQVPHLDLTLRMLLLTSVILRVMAKRHCKIAMMDNAGRVGWRGRAFALEKLVKAYPPLTHTRLLSGGLTISMLR